VALAQPRAEEEHTRGYDEVAGGLLEPSPSPSSELSAVL
jgi:hypothetical protein